MTGIKTVIIATHGTLAEGFKHSLEVICGPQEGVRVMCFYCSDHNFEKEIEQCFRELQSDSQLIICTDIQFGSVNQMFMKEAIARKDKNVQLVSGINLPLLLEIVTTPGIISEERLSEMIANASKQIVYMKLDAFAECVNEELF